MTNAFSSMEYPHWLIVAGAVLLVLGFMGMALRQRVAQAEPKEMASEDGQGRSESEFEPAQAEAADRKAKLEDRGGIDGLITTVVPRTPSKSDLLIVIAGLIVCATAGAMLMNMIVAVAPD